VPASRLRAREHARTHGGGVTCLLLLLPFVHGCAALGSAAAAGFADGLSAAILDQEDPELVRDGAPAFLMMLDALVASDPRNPRFLGAAAQLYAAYGVAFVEDESRAAALAARARDYGARALCAAERDACHLDGLAYEEFAAALDEIGAGDAEALYSYCVAALAFVRTHSADWAAVATLPKISYALQRLLVLGPGEHAASINTYLGVLNTLRPASLGGEPELGRQYFETAIALSDGRDLTAKVEYARAYARLVHDRELHDRLLQEVLDTPARDAGRTLFNTLAQQQARELLASADDYF
jgi:hypothetical protein